MSNEIATYSMIKSKTTFGSDGTECPTKTVIKAISSYIIINNESSYGANECVKIDDIDAIRYIFKYYNHIGDTKWNVGAAGNQLFVTVESRRSDNSTNVPFSFKQLPSWLSRSSIRLKDDDNTKYYMILTASANTSTSARSGTVIIEQNESGLTLEYEVEQAGDSISTYGDWTVSVSANPTTISSDGGTSTITASAKRTVYWASGEVTEETGNPTLSTNLGSLSSTASPSTLTLGENTSTSSRTATIKATHGGKSATCTVTQSGATPSTTYTFSVNPYQVNVGSSGGSGTVTITSYKTVGVNTYDVGFSIDSSTLPSWATYNGSGSFTISANTSSSSRSANVYFVQDESGNRDYVELTQTGYTPPADTYVFIIAPNTYDASYSNATFIPRTVSTKNGSNIGYSLTSGGTDWVVVDTTGKITVEILKNTTYSTRSTTLVFTQNESGKTQSIKITQSGRTPTYTFNVTPTNLSVTAAETNETLTVNSYKTVLKSDGSETTESLNYEFSSNASWVNAARTTTNTTYITVAQNLTTNQRSAKITLTQAESGAQAFVNVIQDGKQEVANRLTLTSLTYSTAYLFPPGEVPVEGPTMYLAFSVPNTFTWNTNKGLTVNRGTIYAGNIGNIYVRENDRYKLVKSFQLQTGDQTISF